MNRRKFLKVANQGALTAAVSLGFSKLLLAQDAAETPLVFYYYYASNASDKRNFQISIYPSAVKDPKNAAGSKKYLKLYVAKYWKNENGDWNHRSSSFEYLMKKSKEDKNVAGKNILTCKMSSVLSGDTQDLSADFAKNMTLGVFISDANNQDSYIEIQDKSGKAIYTLKPPAPPSDNGGDYDGCFITTACVNSMNLPDDCHELQTLRSFRDDYINSTEEGKELAKLYYQISPEIVEQINAYPNSRELYAYIYEKMIIPAVDLVEKGEQEKAKQHYMECVLGLKRSLLEA